jgi:hypothetical protein
MREVKLTLEKMLDERFVIVTEILQVQTIKKPKINFTFATFCYYSKNTIYFTYKKIFEPISIQIIVIDHELAHHIQQSINKNIPKYFILEYLSFFYWSLTSNLWWILRQRAFQEGFAVYVAFLTNRQLNKKTEQFLELLHTKNRFRILFTNARLIPYGLGYLAYTDLATKKSQIEAIKLGLYGHPKDL